MLTPDFNSIVIWSSQIVICLIQRRTSNSSNSVRRGSLLCDVILQVIDPLYLLVSCGSVDSGLLAELSESENLISNFVIGFFALGFLNKLLL